MLWRCATLRGWVARVLCVAVLLASVGVPAGAVAAPGADPCAATGCLCCVAGGDAAAAGCCCAPEDDSGFGWNTVPCGPTTGWWVAPAAGWGLDAAVPAPGFGGGLVDPVIGATGVSMAFGLSVVPPPPRG